jgi:hypothetical protein
VSRLPILRASLFVPLINTLVHHPNQLDQPYVKHID